ncbi:unnamed protein product [Prorocentrum cordatum]|uniref:Subtilisin n=1 Tax=Prorocentrum cordatum TaxID=2364126 RepID=A0ABN9RNP7_9DINO|nr:unnamed protein product [Polarella glacialis]
MAPARGALLGALLLASAAALQPVGDAVGDEAPALEKEEWPRRRARKEARQRLDQMPFEDLRRFGRVMEMDDDLQLRDGPPPAAGCYMRMSSGCPRQPMRTQAWRRDQLASDRGLDDEGCRRRKEVWDRYCGSEDAEMLYVGGQASSKTISTLQVDAVWWPWGKKHESTKLDEEAPAVPAGKPDRTEDESKNDEENEGEEKQNRIINGYPSRPGCYFRQPSKCPAKPQFTSMWRHDTWAEENGLDEAGCKDRKGYWDRYCESNDTKIVHIGADLGIINETSSQAGSFPYSQGVDITTILGS